MVKFSDEGTLPVPRDRLWRFLELHARDDAVGQIHPGILRQQTQSSSAGEYRVARMIDARGTPCPTQWKITYRVPDYSAWEIVEAPNGPMTVGSRVENHYSDVPGGTRIRTDVDLTIARLPRLFQKRIVRRVLRGIDDEDLAYLTTHPTL
jgi:hypothetical protein